jgi:hypothetical protein
MLPTWAKPPRVRQSTMLMRGIDTHGNFDDEPRPDAEWSPTALANWARITEQAREADLRGQRDRPQRSLRGHPRGNMTSTPSAEYAPRQKQRGG